MAKEKCSVDGDITPIEFYRDGYLWLGSGKDDIDSLIANWPGADGALAPGVAVGFEIAQALGARPIDIWSRG